MAALAYASSVWRKWMTIRGGQVEHHAEHRRVISLCSSGQSFFLENESVHYLLLAIFVNPTHSVRCLFPLSLSPPILSDSALFLSTYSGLLHHYWWWTIQVEKGGTKRAGKIDIISLNGYAGSLKVG
jgi:hypothetical protein